MVAPVVIKSNSMLLELIQMFKGIEVLMEEEKLDWDSFFS